MSFYKVLKNNISTLFIIKIITWRFALAKAVFLFYHLVHKQRNVLDDAYAPRLSGGAPKPFQARFLKDFRRATNTSRPYVKTTPKSYCQFYSREVVQVFCYPFLLYGEAEADEKNIGEASCYHLPYP